MSSEDSQDYLSRSVCCIVISRPLSLFLILSLVSGRASRRVFGWPLILFFCSTEGFLVGKSVCWAFHDFWLSDFHREILPRCGFIKHLSERSADYSSRLRAHAALSRTIPPS